MKWETKIAQSGEETLIRGYSLEELIREVSFTEAIHLVLRGELPNDAERRVLDAILVACVDHGTAPPSVIAARAVTSGGTPLQTGVAAGVSSLGEYHGGAIRGAAEVLEEGDAEDIVREHLDAGERIPGFGHKIYEEDPRTKELFRIARNEGMYGEYCRLAEDIAEELYEQKGIRLCLNVDGAIAALLLEMGFPSSMGKAFFIISRTVGLCAHVHEELTEESPVRRLEEAEYTGPDKRHVE